MPDFSVLTTRSKPYENRLGSLTKTYVAVVVLQLALLPVTNAISRRYEAEADWLALRATRNPRAFEGLMRELAKASLADPDPPLVPRSGAPVEAHVFPGTGAAVAFLGDALRQLSAR